MYMTVKQAAENGAFQMRRVRILCSEGKILGVTREGRSLGKIPVVRRNRRTVGIKKREFAGGN